MKAVRLVTQGQALENVEVDKPVLGANDVLVDVKAAGICRSDVHYRAGTRLVKNLPVTPGHEVSGVVNEVGDGVTRVAPGDRVALHYQISCGKCSQCFRGREQFCTAGSMIGMSVDGGYAEMIAVPERNAFLLPDSIPYPIGAVMMCSTATSLHALRKGRFTSGETVAVFGCGGLGMSAIHLAHALGAAEVFAVDIKEDKLALAAAAGATAVPFASAVETVNAFGGADVALELVGLPATMQAAVGSLGVGGRAVAVGITHEPFPLDSYNDLVLREAEIVGAADHLASEIEELLAMVDRGALDLSHVVTATVPLDADAINEAMDSLEAFEGGVRTVIGDE